MPVSTLAWWAGDDARQQVARCGPQVGQSVAHWCGSGAEGVWLAHWTRALSTEVSVSGGLCQQRSLSAEGSVNRGLCQRRALSTAGGQGDTPV
eukprot:COSAG02_NODE_2756_length_8084_cov_3.879649_2_plen_93_part_00